MMGHINCLDDDDVAGLQRKQHQFDSGRERDRGQRHRGGARGRPPPLTAVLIRMAPLCTKW